MPREGPRRGRCARCRVLWNLTVGGTLVAHPPKVPVRCPGTGLAPIDPAEDDTPDWRDRLAVWDANVRLAELADKVRQRGHLSDSERARASRIKYVRANALAGTNRLAKGAAK